jgi:hypothetical protein
MSRGSMPGERRGGGSRKGIPNKTTAMVREAIAKFAEMNVENFSLWVAEVAQTDPARAAEIYLKAIEYHIPKLARSEVRSEVDAEIRIRWLD